MGPVRFLLHLTRLLLEVVKSGRHANAPVSVVVVGVAVGVQIAEIVRVRRIDGTGPHIGRRQMERCPADQHVFRDTPNGQ